MRSHLHSARRPQKGLEGAYSGYCLTRPYLGTALQVRENVVHEAILLGLFGREELVPLDIAADLLLVPAAVPGDDALHRTAHPQDLPGLDLQVTGLPVAALGGRLVQQDARVGQGHALVLGARGEQHGGRGGGLADAHGLDLRLDELHGVVDRHHRRHRPAGRVDVHGDVAVGVDGLQRQQLGHDVVRRGIVNLHAEEDNPLLEELVVRVHLLDPVRGALHEGWQHVPGLRAPQAVLAHVRLLWVDHDTTPAVGTSTALRITLSTKPYSLASSAVNQRSRSASRSICSMGCPVWNAVRSNSVRLMYSICSAWILMSDAVPPIPPDGWCIRICACGRANRLPGAPAVSRNCPIDAAIPIA